MGSFSSICAISKNYIAEGDDVRVMFVAQNGKRETKLLPLFFSIVGKYNDYGYIEDIVEDFNYLFFKNCVTKYFADVLPRSSRAPGGLEKLLDSTYANSIIGGACLPKLFARSKKDPIFEEKTPSYSTETSYEMTEHNDTHITFVFVKERVYQAILKNGTSRSFYLDYDYQNKFWYNTVVNNTPDFFESFAKSLQVLINKDDAAVKPVIDDKEAILLELLKKLRDHDTRKEFPSMFFSNNSGDVEEQCTLDIFPHADENVSKLQLKLFKDVLFVAHTYEYHYNTDCFSSPKNNMFVLELLNALRTNDISTASNILKSYIELFLYSCELSKLNIEFDGSVPGHSGEQFPGISDAVNTLNVTSAVVSDLFDVMFTRSEEPECIELESYGIVPGYDVDAYNADLNRAKMIKIRDSLLAKAKFLTTVLDTPIDE